MSAGSADRIAAAIELLSVLRGGDMPNRERLEGLTQEELQQAEGLWMQGIEAGRPLDDEHLVKMAYLAKNAPGLTVGEAIASLNPEQLAEFNALTGDEL